VSAHKVPVAGPYLLGTRVGEPVHGGKRPQRFETLLRVSLEVGRLRGDRLCAGVCDGVCSRALCICANLLTNARQVGWVDELKLREEVRLLGHV
jgi:hypothetical protein